MLWCWGYLVLEQLHGSCLRGGLGAEAPGFVHCSKQDAESHPGRAAASCPVLYNGAAK